MMFEIFTFANVQSSIHGSIKYTKLDFHLLGRRTVVAVDAAVAAAAAIASVFSTAIFVIVELSDELVLVYRCAGIYYGRLINR